MKSLITTYLVFISLVVGLVGCGSITPQELINVEIACRYHDGLRELHSNLLFNKLEAECMDGYVVVIGKKSN